MSGRIPEDIGDYSFDLIVVGAGINGCGIARDASLRGLKVLLLDKGDISSGTTSWSSRLIHGGLRYLEHYEFALVRESLSDREKLLKMAPHLVFPIPCLVPVYDHSKRGKNLIRLGMMLYDTLSFDKSMDNHKILSREEALERDPGLKPDGLKGAAVYYDAQVEYAERLAVENTISAVENGTTVITYAKVTDVIVEDSSVVGVEFEDEIDGGSYRAHAPVTVNVAGPWVDLAAGKANAGRRMMGGTKGSHLVVGPFPGAPEKDVIYYEAISDGRPILVIPWNGCYLIGATDIRYDGDLDYVSASDEEIEYIISETNLLIPEANLTSDDVIFSYSGIRPLPYAEAGAEGSITRSHTLYDYAKDDEPLGGLISIIGGKLTTFRNLSRQTVDMVYGKLGRKAPKSTTAKLALPGAAVDDFSVFADEFKASSGLPAWLSERLISLYGVRARDVLDCAGDDASLLEPLSDGTPSARTGLVGAEVIHAFRNEMATMLADVLLRRTLVGMSETNALDVDEAAAAICVKRLGWSEDRAKSEVEDYRKFLERYRPRELASV